jgi:SAM-dependent methyltransferase
MPRITVGIPCFGGFSAETGADYMRFLYHLGRRVQEHEFFLAIKPKTEQFRARNMIVEAALQVDSDYLLFLDDDHIIDWESVSGPNERYGFIRTLVRHLEADEKRGIVGALYYHRGNECRPVLMKEGNDGGTYWMRDDEIVNGLQEVAIAGGGCMLIAKRVWDKIPSPWFEPELQFGTDIQVCQKARAAGFSVWCDTSIVLGHVLAQREIVTPRNRHRIAAESAARNGQGDDGIDAGWRNSTTLRLYLDDAGEYMDLGAEEMFALSESYKVNNFSKFSGFEDPEDYYRSLGHEQLARQVVFHHTAPAVDQMETILKLFRVDREFRGLDVGCGSAPVGFELAMRGHHVDFIDIPGAEAYEFTKWRAQKRGIEARCGWDWGEDYDYALLLDSIEHFTQWEDMLDRVIRALKPDGALITNYFLNCDYHNPEHVNMEKGKVTRYLTDHGVYPLNEMLWIKRDLGFMDRPKENVA